MRKSWRFELGRSWKGLEQILHSRKCLKDIPTLTTAVLSVLIVVLLVLHVIRKEGFLAGESSTAKDSLESLDLRLERADEIVRSSKRFFEVNYVQPPRELDVPEVDVAYFVQVSKESLPLFPRLLQRIYHPKNVYVVHFDLKIANNSVQEAMLNIRKDIRFTNVYFLKREPVTYRGITMVTNTMSAMTFLLQLDSAWDYFINLSGCDYPMVTPQQQRRLLALRRERPLFFYLFGTNHWERFYQSRVGIIHVDPAVSFSTNSTTLFSFHHYRHTTFRSPLLDYKDFDYAKAEAWMMVPRDFCRYVVEGAFPRRLLSFLANSASSPEHYFVTVAWNFEEFRQRIVQNAFRAVVWSDGKKHSGQHPYDLDCYSDIFRFWKHIRKAKGFFARKFTIPDNSLMLRIDKECLGLDPNGLNHSRSYLQSVEKKMVSLTEAQLGKSQSTHTANADSTLHR